MKRNEFDGHSLDCALLRLLPDVFFHPVWAYFAQSDISFSPGRIQSLQRAAEELQNQGDVGSACQVWLSCAAQQGRAAEYPAALESVQRTLALAERYALPNVTCWAAWGGCAVCARRGDFQRAADYLQRLGMTLRAQHEWILADVIDVIAQCLFNLALDVDLADVEAALISAFDSSLKVAVVQLLHWGEPPALPGDLAVPADHDSSSLASHSPLARFKYRWRQFWLSVRKILKGELRLQWVPESHSPTRPPDWRAEVSTQSAAGNPNPVPKPLKPLTPSPAEMPQPIGLVEPPAYAEVELSAKPSSITPTLTIYTLGTFHLAVNDVPTNHLLTGKSRTVLEYLLIHHSQPVSRDVLMDVFWPDAKPDSARNRLNVSLHSVRQALRSITEMPVVLFEDNAYHINPEFDLWLDVEEFDQHARKGRQLEAADHLTPAVKEYELARDVYQADFLVDEPYEDWPVLLRERLRADYLDILDRLSQIYFDQGGYADCVALSQLLLSRDNCREDTHCRLMQCYSRQNQRYLALRQYHACVKALRTELEVDPAPTTTQLYERVRRRERV